MLFVQYEILGSVVVVVLVFAFLVFDFAATFAATFDATFAVTFAAANYSTDAAVAAVDVSDTLRATLTVAVILHIPGGDLSFIPVFGYFLTVVAIGFCRGDTLLLSCE